MMATNKNPAKGGVRHSIKSRLLTDIMLMVFRLNARLLEQGDQLVAPLQLSSARWQVLGAVAIAGQPLSAPQIADAMGVTRQGVQKQLNRMLDEGLFEIRPNPRHERSPLYALTETGLSAYGNAMRLHQQWVDALVDGIARKELEAVLPALQQIYARLEQMPVSALSVISHSQTIS